MKFINLSCNHSVTLLLFYLTIYLYLLILYQHQYINISNIFSDIVFIICTIASGNLYLIPIVVVITIVILLLMLFVMIVVVIGHSVQQKRKR